MAYVTTAEPAAVIIAATTLASTASLYSPIRSP